MLSSFVLARFKLDADDSSALAAGVEPLIVKAHESEGYGLVAGRRAGEFFTGYEFHSVVTVTN